MYRLRLATLMAALAGLVSLAVPAVTASAGTSAQQTGRRWSRSVPRTTPAMTGWSSSSAAGCQLSAAPGTYPG
jgi:hypothetical protein